MDTELLKSFLVLVRLKSFTLSAKELEITQPALSKRIKRLESLVGTPLIDRDSSHLALTQAGNLLLEKAPSIINGISQSIQEIRDLSGTISGTLRIATSHYIGMYQLPKALEQFISQYPDVDVTIDFLDSGKAYRQVLAGDIEVALITFPQEQDERAVHIPQWQETMQICFHQEHELAQFKQPLLHLSQYPCLLPPAHTFPRELFEHQLNALGIERGQVKTAHYLEVIAKLAACKMGWALLPERLIEQPLIAISGKKHSFSREMGIMHRNNKQLSNAAKAFINTLESILS